MQELKVLEGAEEFAFNESDPGETGILLVHGFTGSPQSTRPLGEYLGDKGLPVVGIRLPGHGTTWEDLNTRTAKDWVGTVDAALDQMTDRYERVFMVGLSFGVALSLDAATRRPADVAGIVSLAGFVDTRDPRRFAAPVVRYLVKSLPGVGNDICDPDGRELCYDRLPTSAAYAMLSFCKSVRGKLADVTQPLLVIHSRNDHTAHPGNAELIHERVSSTDKELVWVDRSYHVITLDHDREEVFRRTFEFIDQRTGQDRSGV